MKLILFVLACAQPAAAYEPPSYARPVRTWAAPGAAPVPGLNLDACMGDSFQTMKRDENGELLPACRPDTLYSWGSLAKVTSLEALMGAGAWTRGRLPRPIFAARSPISTFAYGPVAIRIRLKPGVPFIKGTFEDCAGGRPDAVYFRADSAFSDWVVCSTEVIASWSYDTKLHYDEIVREYRRVRDLEESGARLRGRVDFYSYSQADANDIYRVTIDGHRFDNAVLKDDLRTMLVAIQNSSGRTYLNPDAK